MIFQITLPEESAIHKWKKLKLIISVFRGKRHFFFESNATENHFEKLLSAFTQMFELPSKKPWLVKEFTSNTRQQKFSNGQLIFLLLYGFVSNGFFDLLRYPNLKKILCIRNY